jgi:hypothetical protein
MGFPTIPASFHIIGSRSWFMQRAICQSRSNRIRWRGVTFSWANELSDGLYKWRIGRDGGDGAGRDPAMLKVVGEASPAFPLWRCILLSMFESAFDGLPTRCGR